MNDALLSLSIANISFLFVWKQVLGLAGDPWTRFMAAPPSDFSILFALMFDVCVLGLLLFIAFSLRRSQVGLARVAATAVISFFALYALFDLQHLGTELARETFQWNIRATSKIIVAVLFIVLFLRFRKRLLRIGRSVLLIASPLFFVLSLNGLWTYHVANGDDPGHAAGMLPSASNSNRAIWIVFDELDAKMLFDTRPQRIQLSELDRLRNQALDGTRVTTPADATAASMASMLLGRVVKNGPIIPVPPNQLKVEFSRSSKLTSFNDQPNIFRRARVAGFNTAISGWMYPYCRLLGNDLSDCAWQGSGFNLLMVKRGLRKRPFHSKAFYLAEWQARIFPFVLYHRSDRPEDERLARESSIAVMRYVTGNALRMLANPQLNLVLLHFPVPHPPGIWDVQKHVFTSGHANYVDNLQLADDTLGRLRRELEKTGAWDRTTVLVSGDHPYRQMWQEFDAGTFNREEIMQITKGHQEQYVPFLLKLPFQHERVEYGRQFNNVISGDILFDALKGNLRDPGDAVKWLDEHSAAVGS